MKRILAATPIILTEAERVELDGLVRSRKTEHRLRQRARIVLLAADGMSTRAIGREVGCTTGTASKWRVRYAERRLGRLGRNRQSWQRVQIYDRGDAAHSAGSRPATA